MLQSLEGMQPYYTVVRPSALISKLQQTTGTIPGVLTGFQTLARHCEQRIGAAESVRKGTYRLFAAIDSFYSLGAPRIRHSRGGRDQSPIDRNSYRVRE